MPRQDHAVMIRIYTNLMAYTVFESITALAPSFAVAAAMAVLIFLDSH